MAVIWTEARVEKLCDLYRDGLSYSVIAARLSGVSRNAIAGRVAKLVNGGVLVRRRPRDDKPEITVGEYIRPFNPAYTEKAPPTQPEPEIFDPLLTDGKPVTIRNCTDRTCRWPMSEASADMMMCGRTVKAGTPYCESHARKVYQSSQNQASRQRQAEATADAIG